MLSKKTAHWMGVGSASIIAGFWVLVLNPLGWHLGFQGDIFVSELTILAACLGSVVAFFKSSRWWCLSIVACLLTLAAALRALR
jgi:hypothetical protein